jgi:hypothetical protein
MHGYSSFSPLSPVICTDRFLKIQSFLISPGGLPGIRITLLIDEYLLVETRVPGLKAPKTLYFSFEDMSSN